MKKQTSVLTRLYSPWMAWTWNLLFYGAVLVMIATSHPPMVSDQVSFLLKKFWADDQELFRLENPGLAFTPFEPWLRKKGRFSFITDIPYGPKNAATEPFQAAQGLLAPCVLNTKPVENQAIVFCSNNIIAEIRMKETGYKLIKSLENGKGIAEKKP